MEKRYSVQLKIVGLLCLFSLISFEVRAQWKLLKELPATYAVFITKSGNMLMSDFLMDIDPKTGAILRPGKGGIYLSKDKGESWKKVDAPDYSYNKFYEFGDYVFAGGSAGRIARSSDSGETWELLNYTLPLAGIVDNTAIEQTSCYAMEYHNGKLFIGDFNGGGVLYSEDMGETWSLTERSSLKVETPSGVVVENIYSLAAFNGKLYAFGVYYIFEYVDEYNLWMIKRSDSNFMCQTMVFKDKLYGGRSVMNQGEQSAFLERTSDGETWEWVPRPKGQRDNNVRVINHDENNIYVGLQTKGIYYTDNEGETWAEISEGLPPYAEDFTEEYISPLQIAVDDEFIYVAMYEDAFYSDRKVSGVYRFAKKNLPPTPSAIRNLSADADFQVFANDSYLQIKGNMEFTISVFDMYGKHVDVNVQDGNMDIRNLASGVYVYELITKDGKAVGKFLKK